MEVYIFTLLILALAILVGSTLGFGDSLIFIPFAALFLDIYIAIVLMGFWTTVLSIFNAIKYRHYFDKLLIKKYLAPGIIGVLIGSLLLILAPIHLIEFSLGVFIILFIIAKFSKIRKENNHKTPEVNPLVQSPLKDIPNFILYPGAFAYGFVGGLIGTPGPINVAILERRGHERESFIGNFSLISVIITSLRLIIYVSNDLFPIEFLTILIIGIIVTYGVTKCGHWLTPKIPKKQFKILVLLLLAIIGLRLIINSILFFFNFNL
ncbi:MAG: sulfite exporter TauE/SafE family protein [Promethearchaeota archaeon]|nr:MAG: sulfite exporter TauE/SafE family protein [Candidatus Lokiarchaeota archaeon]